MVVTARRDLTTAALAVNELVTKLRDAGCLEGEDGDQLLADMIEGETDFYEAVDALLDQIGQAGEIMAGIDARMKQLEARRAGAEKRAETIRDALAAVLEQFPELGPMRRPEATIWSARSPGGVRIYDEAALPFDLWREKVEKAPDKKAIREALLAGKTVDGAELTAGKLYLGMRRA